MSTRQLRDWDKWNDKMMKQLREERARSQRNEQTAADHLFKELSPQAEAAKESILKIINDRGWELYASPYLVKGVGIFGSSKRRLVATFGDKESPSFHFGITEVGEEVCNRRRSASPRPEFAEFATLQYLEDYQEWLRYATYFLEHLNSRY